MWFEKGIMIRWVKMNGVTTTSMRFVISLSLLLCSCDFLSVDPPTTKLTSDLVFRDDASAESVVAAMYLNMYYPSGNSNGFASGNSVSIASLAGLSSDELHHNGSDPVMIQFEQNILEARNEYVLALWRTMYKSIYDANAILEGLAASDQVTDGTRKQLEGEAYFVRAFCHFYLVNCFGEVPVVTTTNYKINAVLTRSTIQAVYDQIESDLLDAESRLAGTYWTLGKVRPNKFTATAFLARFYLYKKDWQRAEDKSSNVIAQIGLYSMPSNLGSVFLSTSAEAIWQLKPKDLASYTNEGKTFGTVDGPSANVLTTNIVNSFETGDKRRTDWIISVGSGSATTYLPYKYKLQFPTTIESNEYSVVLRLAEQYLIRAEARAQQPGKLPLAISDVDVVRGRAGLLLIQNITPTISKENLLLAIEQERKVEFFTEWGHRWFDLKRSERVDDILAPIKPGWNAEDRLYPIPEDELLKNPNLKPQNAGY